MLLLISLALGADCATRPGTSSMLEDAHAVGVALESGDPQRFNDGLIRLERTVECLGEIPSPDATAAYRMYRGIQSFGDGKTDVAALEFLAARALKPELALPVYPPEHAINGVVRRLDPIRAEREKLPTPKTGTLYVDGYATRDRFLGAPAVIQLVRDGQVDTMVVAPGEQPSYASRHPVRNTLSMSSVGLGAAGVGLIAASAVPHGKFNRGEADTVSEFNALRGQTNTLAGTGLGLVSAGLVTGAAAYVFRDR
jgi:hypothetical protein